MGRAAHRGEQGLRKGQWTPEEDKILVKHIEKHGCGRWNTIPKHAGKTHNNFFDFILSSE